MTPEQAISEAESGALKPVYLVLGEEQLLVHRVVEALRISAQKGGIAGFNDDKFMAQEVSAEQVMLAAKMLPMMAPRRFVLVRGLERWEPKKAGDDDGDGGSSAKDAKPLDILAEYAKAPSPSTVMVLVATKLHGSRRLVTDAKKRDYVVGCEPLARKALPGFIHAAAKKRGHSIPSDVAEMVAEMSGPDLGCVDDAVERLSLYVGPGAPITEEAVAKVVTRVRQSTVWELLDALSARRLDKALGMLAEVYDQRDGGLKLLGAVSWSVRQLVKFESAIRNGEGPSEAAQRAGVPPFRARDVQQTLRGMPKGTIDKWLSILAETDLALKGSRRPADAILEGMIISMCR